VQFVRDSGDTVSLFAGRDYSSEHALVDYRVKQLAYACVQAVHENRLAILAFPP
jgi:ubiquitin-protein ligase E3 C